MMATKNTSARESTPTAPQTPPPQMGYGSVGLSSDFIWQQLNDIQKTLGAIQESQRHGEVSFEKTHTEISAIKSDVSDIKQLKNTAKTVLWIVGVVLAGMLTAAGWVFSQIWDISKPLILEKFAESSQKTQPHPAASTQPSRPDAPKR